MASGDLTKVGGSDSLELKVTAQEPVTLNKAVQLLSNGKMAPLPVKTLASDYQLLVDKYDTGYLPYGNYPNSNDMTHLGNGYYLWLFVDNAVSTARYVTAVIFRIDPATGELRVGQKQALNSYNTPTQPVAVQRLKDGRAVAFYPISGSAMVHQVIEHNDLTLVLKTSQVVAANGLDSLSYARIAVYKEDEWLTVFTGSTTTTSSQICMPAIFKYDEAANTVTRLSSTGLDNTYNLVTGTSSFYHLSVKYARVDETGNYVFALIGTYGGTTYYFFWVRYNPKTNTFSHINQSVSRGSSARAAAVFITKDGKTMTGYFASDGYTYSYSWVDAAGSSLNSKDIYTNTAATNELYPGTPYYDINGVARLPLYQLISGNLSVHSILDKGMEGRDVLTGSQPITVAGSVGNLLAQASGVIGGELFEAFISGGKITALKGYYGQIAGVAAAQDKIVSKGRVKGYNGLIAGAPYYADGDGSLTTTPIEGQRIGVALSPNELYLAESVLDIY